MRILFVTWLCFVFASAFGQSGKYKIYSFKNNEDQLFQGKKQLRVNDTLDVGKRFYLNHNKALIKVQDADGRILTIAFTAGKPVKVIQPSSAGVELFEFLVGDYIKRLNTNTVLMASRPWDVDFINFFKDFDENTGHNILFLSRDSISLKSKFITLGSAQHFYACIFKGQDSSLLKLESTNDFVILTADKFRAKQDQALVWKLKIATEKNNKISIYEFSPKITSVFLDRKTLFDELTFVAKGIDTSDKIKSACKAFLLTTYGKYNPLTIEPIIEKVCLVSLPEKK